LLRLMAQLGSEVHGLAHVTGGGLPGNLPRAVRDDLGVRVEVDAWPLPEIFERVQRAAGLARPELRATFNAGIGMAAIVSADATETAISSLAAAGVQAWLIGRVEAAERLGARYVEA
jgi:phosphoribosylformylglycinamidine cyclo-ligase